MTESTCSFPLGHILNLYVGPIQQETGEGGLYTEDPVDRGSDLIDNIDRKSGS